MYSSTLFISLIALANVSLTSAAAIEPRQWSGVAKQVLEIGESAIKEKRRKDYEASTGVNLIWYKGDLIGIRCTDGWYDCGGARDANQYLPGDLRTCVDRNNGNTEWCIQENLCCWGNANFEGGCNAIGVDVGNRNEWCLNTHNSYQ